MPKGHLSGHGPVASVANAGTLGRPRGSVLAFGSSTIAVKQVAQLTSSQSIQSVIFVCCGLLLGLAGCSSPGSPQPGKLADPVARTSFWKPYLLFIQATPYPRLYVEVDAVEGMAPDDESLRRLREFLGAFCAKPAGIQIVRDSVIPRVQARGIAPGALARKYLAGPDRDASAPPAAFIYVLFFDTALSRDAGTNAPRGAAATASLRPSAQAVAPHADLLPYPAIIFADPLFNGPLNAPKLSRLFGPILQHEAGHLLGLGRNPTHAADLHCRETSCLMYREYSPAELLLAEIWADTLGTNSAPRLRLCANCQADAQAYAREPIPSNLHFFGPVFVRSEAGYQVLALPGRLKLVVGQFDERDAWEFARAVQSEAFKRTEADSSFLAIGTVKPEARQDRARLRETLKRARQDPLDAVRAVAAQL